MIIKPQGYHLASKSGGKTDLNLKTGNPHIHGTPNS